MKHTNFQKGFTMVELMIVVTIVAILIGLALPNYTRYVLKANRGEAQSLLLNWANNQELWRANNTTYAGVGSPIIPSHEYYGFVPSNISATTYTLTATAPSGGKQEDDVERGTSCASMTLDQDNVKTELNCW